MLQSYGDIRYGTIIGFATGLLLARLIPHRAACSISLPRPESERGSSV